MTDVQQPGSVETHPHQRVVVGGHCGGPDQRRAALSDGEMAITNLTP